MSAKLLSSKQEEPVDKIAAAPRTPFANMPEADRVLGHIAVPFAEIEPLSNNSPYTVNDIAVTIIAGAMREYLLSTGELPEAELQTLIPIDIRAADDQDIGNQLSFAKMQLFASIEDPLQRLQSVHQGAQAFKKSHLAMGPSVLLDFANATYPSVISKLAAFAVGRGVIDKVAPICNTIISNVPGIPLPCYLRGAQLVDYVGLGFLVPSVSLFHVISSVPGHVNISYLSCANSLQDPERYTQALQNSYNALLASINVNEAA